MATGWTEERRARQAEAIKRWRPWEKSTGPTSAEGKAASSRNAFRGAERDAIRSALRDLREVLREQRAVLRQFEIDGEG